MDRNLIPNFLFRFRDEHGTVEQIHRVVIAINTFEYCTAVFLDVQACNKVWHNGLLLKLQSSLH